MDRIVLLGAGKIGRMITKLLSQSGNYSLCVADAEESALTKVAQHDHVDTLTIDAMDRDQLKGAMTDCTAVISALSFRFNPLIAEVATETKCHYFDLTEDVETTRMVKLHAKNATPGQVFMPQCGLAPGFISIVAHDLTKWFDEIDSVHMRVGALPQYPTNAFKYNLTWSTDGLINEYCNPCEAIHEGDKIDVLPLEGHEHFSLDGVRYEAFNTSGGLGTLCDTLSGRVRELNYKTIRYQGHRDLASFLVDELRLGHRRELLKDILEHAIPVTFQDVVVIFCTVKGTRNGQFVQRSDARKVYWQTFDDEVWSAIQITTAAGVCASVDLVLSGDLKREGFVCQEEISLDQFLANRFGKYYDQ